MNKKLKPCPFCAAQPESYPYSYEDIDDCHEIACTNDDCGMSPATGPCTTVAEAERYWNTRAPVSQWKPIESAPKDNDKPILITDGKQVGIRVLDEEDGECFFHDYPDSYNLYPVNPTHWMPLPEPPTVKQGKGV